MINAYKNESDFLKLLESSEKITGKFRFNLPSDSLMDLDIKNKDFENCLILGGDFASDSFRNCTFNNIVIRGANLVGLNFTDCKFIKCKFVNTDNDLSMCNCNVTGLTITRISDDIWYDID